MVKSFLCILKCNHSSLQNNYSTQETISTCGELVIVCNDHTTLAIIIVAQNGVLQKIETASRDPSYCILKTIKEKLIQK